MQRRSFPLALAGAALIPVLAHAQGAAPHAATPPAGLSGMSPAQLAMATHEAGAFSLATARIGVEKASHADVKRFANFEVIEQEGISKAMALAGHHFAEPRFSGDKAATIQRLQGASGADFDRMFLQVQQQGHQELLNLTTAIMASHAPVPDMITATLSNGQIKEHLILIGAMMDQR